MVKSRDCRSSNNGPHLLHLPRPPACIVYLLFEPIPESSRHSSRNRRRTTPRGAAHLSHERRNWRGQYLATAYGAGRYTVGPLVHLILSSPNRTVSGGRREQFVLESK